MDFLNINGQYGHFFINLKEISNNGIAYFEIKDYTNLQLVIKEAVDIIKTYSPKLICYTVNNCNLDCNILYSEKEYFLSHRRYKSNKNFKFKQLDLVNRYDFSKIYERTIEDYCNMSSLNSADVFEMMKDTKNNLGYIIHKKEIIAIYNIKGNYIDIISLDKLYQNRGYGSIILEKLINKIDNDVYVKVSSNNKRMISLLEKMEFIYNNKCINWYIWEE